MDTAVTDRYAQFRGALLAGLGHDSALIFVTRHAEGQPTAVYRLDLDKGELTSSPLPAGGAAIVADDAAIYVAGTDGRVHRGPLGGGALSPLGEPLAATPGALALLSEDRLAVRAGDGIAILARKTGKLLEKLALPEAGTALAADRTGQWLAAGTSRGALVVFECEDKSGFVASESKKIHEGAITALLFDPDELRVYSSGSDNRLLLTHVRGELEPEDRAGGAAHENLVQAIALGPEDKIYTAGRDGVIKTWTRGASKRRPATLKDGVSKGVALARVEHRGRPHLALLGEDQTIRLFPLDAGGKVGERALTFHDAYAWARHELSQREPARREAAAKALARYNDEAAIDLLVERASEDPDHSLKVQAARLLGESGNPRAVKPLEELLGASEEQVRLVALAGLRALEGEESWRPLDLALAAGRRDVGVVAVQALEARARTDDQAMERIVQAIDHDLVEVRVAALAALESLHDPKGPEGSLIALRGARADVRRLALVRLFQRKLLDHADVQAAVRRHQGDADADVRRAAFLVSVMSRPALADALRARDRDMHRQLWELERIGEKAETGKAAEGEKQPPELEPPKTKKTSAPLGDDDVRPLLEAMASRSLDTCLLGARGLASLQDERAFGTLLQLTNERPPAARVEACKALAELADPRGIKRLRQMLRDAAGEVRDAAFSALTRLEEKAPLRAAEAGLMAPNEDIRGRGLQLLARQLKKGGAGAAEKAPAKAPAKAAKGAAKGAAAKGEAAKIDEAKGAADPGAPREDREIGVRLLERALNDTSAAVRGEAFKAALNLEIGGDEAGTLRFALRSIHAQLRREVLSEVMGRIQEPWAPGLVLELFADPDPGVRAEAFEFAQKRGKGKALEPLETALGGRHVDLKLKAIEALSKRRGGSEAERGGVRALLERALGDDDEQVRKAAVEALLVDEADESLVQAMASPHADVRVRAAAARAVHGDPKALEPLLALATEKEPDLAEKRADWVDRVARALDGLGELGATAALGPVTALAQHKEKRIHDAAAAALGWVSRPAESGGDLAALKEALSHPDKDVKLEAALGLASSGDASGIALLKELAQATGGKSTDTVTRGLRASLALGQQADDLLMAFLDHADERVRGRALLVMMLVESSERDGIPDRCLAALSSAHPRVRLIAARALEAYADPAAFAAFVADLLNDRGDDRAPWTIPASAARALAELCTHADPHLRVRAARLLDALDDEKPERFDRQWRVFSRRFAAEIDALLDAAKKRAPAPLAYAPDELRRVVLGAYAGLSRQGGGALEARVRQTAITRLVDLAQRDAELAPSVLPVLRIALGDGAQPVRKLAFESLQKLGMTGAALGAEALSVGARDMGVAGLKLLAETGDDKARLEVLDRVMTQYTDGLEEEAAKLIAEQRGWPAVHERGLEAKSPAARERSVAGLAQSYEQHESARAALRGALASRYRHVRDRAALELAGKKDAAAFDALVAMLTSEQQEEAIDALTRLGDPRTPGALLDRIDKDPAGTALTGDLLSAAGTFRIPATADRLLGYLEDKKTRRAAMQAALTVSGHDQPILEEEDDSAPPAQGPRPASPGDLAPWEKTQRPRHDAILAKLLDAAIRLGDAAMITALIPSARWARGPEVGPVLAPLASFSRDDLRDLAVEALGFRLRRRGGSADPLVAALAHPSPATQLSAAEGLALGGRADGLRVLLTAIDLAAELDERRRAVRALGRLGDARALDVLLRLAGEEGHALQEEAAEAIGHLRATPKAQAIEEVLIRLAKGSGGVALQALAGLRWFGSAAGWALIRARAGDDLSDVRQKAVELLAHDADPAGRDVLVSRIEEETDWSVAHKAAASLRKLEGWGSLEPDYVVIRSYFTGLEDRTLQRLRERGEPARILELLPKIHASNEEALVMPLVTSLLVRDPLPLEAAAASLESPHERVAGVAAQILGRGGKAAAKAHGKALAAATEKAAAAWRTARAAIDRARDDGRKLEPHTERWRRMIWACGKLGVGGAQILEAVALGDDPWAKPVRIEALAALATGIAGDAGLDALSAAVLDSDGRQRTLAAAALAEVAPDRASGLVPRVLDDRSSLDGLLRGPKLSAAVAAALRGAAASVHTQGVALPHLVATEDVDGLSAALADKKLAEPARLGALEALARIATDAALAPLLATAKSDAEDEEIRKAAWRGLRRAHRQRKAREAGRVTR